MAPVYIIRVYVIAISGNIHHLRLLLIQMQEATMNTSIMITEESHWFSGHFPDNPILPGVAQLKYVVDLISSYYGTNLHIGGLSRVKFRKIVHPGELLNIEVTPTDKKNHYIFSLTSGNEDVCSGRMSITPQKK